jgi:hypothetical protein
VVPCAACRLGHLTKRAQFLDLATERRRHAGHLERPHSPSESERGQSQKALSLLWGTEGSNPSTTESAANLTLSIRMPNISCRHQFAGRPCAEGAQPPWPGGGKEKAPRKESPSARVKHETAALRGGGDPNVNRSTRNCTARAALAGESSIRPVVAALANAVFDASGVRMRRAPLTPERLKPASA